MAQEFLTVDLGAEREVAGLVTRGAGSVWLEAFRLSYSSDGLGWSAVQDPASSTDIVFPGNHEGEEVLTQYLPRLLSTRYIRVTPLRLAP